MQELEAAEPLAQPYYIPEECGDDPREYEDWFLRLPEFAKDEMRQRWRAQAGFRDASIARFKRTRKRYMIEALVVFLLSDILLWVLSGDLLFVGALVGLAVGYVAFTVRAGTYTYATLGMVGYIVFNMMTGWWNIVSMVWILCSCTVLGMSHQLQRFDGSEN